MCEGTVESSGFQLRVCKLSSINSITVVSKETQKATQNQQQQQGKASFQQDIQYVIYKVLHYLFYPSKRGIFTSQTISSQRVVGVEHLVVGCHTGRAETQMFLFVSQSLLKSGTTKAECSLHCLPPSYE